MHPIVNAVLFLLREKQASGNHPDGEVQKHIDQVVASMAPVAELPKENAHAAEPQGRENDDPQGEHAGTTASVE
jgi:hypothetical protein